MIKLTVESNFSSFKEFQKELQHTLIQNGLDKPLNTALDRLKQELSTLIDTDIRNVPEDEETSQKDGKINISKSDETILKHLTGVDVREINSTGKAKSMLDSKTCFVDKIWLKNAGKNADVVRVKVPLGPDTTIEAAFIKARDFFNSAMFVLPNADGTLSFKQNIGLNLEKYTKIVCSTETGVTDHSNYRFKRSYASKGKDFVEFSLSKDAYNELRKDTKGLLDLTQYINLIKDGKHDIAQSALSAASSVSSGKSKEAFDNLADKTTELQKGGGTADVRDLGAIKDLINSVTFEKTNTSDSIIYTLVADVTVAKDDIQDFYDKMISKVNNWVIENHDIWYKKFINTAQEIIKKYTGVYVS